jgi:hypothetical protein
MQTTEALGLSGYPPQAWRNGYSLACLVEVTMRLLKGSHRRPGAIVTDDANAGTVGDMRSSGMADSAEPGLRGEALLQQCLRQLDLGLMMGGPLWQRHVHAMVDRLHAAAAVEAPAPVSGRGNDGSGERGCGWGSGGSGGDGVPGANVVGDSNGRVAKRPRRDTASDPRRRSSSEDGEEEEDAGPLTGDAEGAEGADGVAAAAALQGWMRDERITTTGSPGPPQEAMLARGRSSDPDGPSPAAEWKGGSAAAGARGVAAGTASTVQLPRGSLGGVPGCRVPAVEQPGLEEFLLSYMVPEQPVVVTGEAALRRAQRNPWLRTR